MSNITNDNVKIPITEMIGPFKEEYYHVVVDGFDVPYVTLRKNNLDWDLIVDGRYSITASGDEMDRWIWIVANAMAIAAGYTSHGENSVPINPFHRRLIGLSLAEFDEVKGGEE